MDDMTGVQVCRERTDFRKVVKKIQKEATQLSRFTRALHQLCILGFPQ